MNAITIRQDLTPSVWDMVQAIAPTFYKSRLFGIPSEAQTAVIMIKGHELGFSLSSSFEFIHVIDGRPSLSPRGALALVFQSGQLAGMNIADDGTTCTVWMKRANGIEYQSDFSHDDAKRAGLVKDKSGWDKYPKSMRKWRAVGFCIDILFPDVSGGMKRSDEFGADLTPNGDIIEGSWQTVPAPAARPVDTAAAQLQELVTTFGAAAVMEANGGMIPGSSDEIAAVSAKLQSALESITLDTVEEVAI